jgi:transglutaminase-like putative cysteine protease
MPEPARPGRAEQAALIAVAAAAVSAFAGAYHSPAAWLLLAPAAVWPFWRIRRVPARVQAAVLLFARAVLLATLLFGIAWSLYPVLPPALVQRGPRLAGHLLVGLLAVFVLGPLVWPPAGAAIPAALGLLVIAAFEKGSAPAWGPVLLTAAALVAYAIASSRTVRPVGSRPGTTPRFGRTTALVATAAVLATAVARLLPWAQPFVEASVVQALSPYAQYGGFSDNTTLGSIEELSLSPRIVMRVWTDTPQKLRARAYARFDGLGWHASPNEAGVSLVATPPPERLTGWLGAIPGRDFVVPGQQLDEASEAGAIRTRIVQDDLSGMLVAPEAMLLVRLAHADPRIDRFGVMRPLYPTPRVYGVINRRAAAHPTRLTLDLPDAARAEALALPPGLDPRLRELADRLSAEGRDDAGRLQRTLGYLYANCRYSLKVGKFRTKQPVAEFLFEKKRGYCEYFASAAAVLLRMQGIPTRYVAGFNVTDDNRRAGHYVVRESHAHAWIEVALPGAGWVEADPTPAAQYTEVHPPADRDRLGDALEWLSATWAELAARMAGGDPLELLRWVARELWASIRQRPLAVAAIGFLAALWSARGRLARLAARRRRARRPTVEPGTVPLELAELVARLDEELARAGYARSAASAPLEHLEGLPPDRLSGPMQSAARKIVDSFYEARFGGVDVPVTRIRELDEALRSAKVQ